MLSKRNALLIFCPLATGILFSLSVAPFDYWYLAYIAHVPLLFLVCRSPLSETVLAFTAASLIISASWWYSVVAYSWLIFIQIAVVVGISYATWAVLSKVLYNGLGDGWWSALVPALVWVGIERILTSSYVGVPHNMGLTQYRQPELIQLAALFGIYAVSFLVVAVNGLLAYALHRFIDYREKIRTPVIMVAVAIAVLSLNYLYGVSRLNDRVDADVISVGVLQPVILSEIYRNSRRNAQDRQWIEGTLDELTHTALAENRDMLFWPEGGDGTIVMRLPEERSRRYTLAREHGTDLLISSDDIASDGRKYNSIFSISKDGQYQGRHDKVLLVPGGESTYSPGGVYNLLPTSYGYVAAAICYETNFPEIFRRYTERGANILFASTSDSAFKRSSLPLSHANLSVFRAVENNRWLIHASNAGPSMLVSPLGEIKSRTAMFDRTVLYGEISSLDDLTPYTRWGYVMPDVLASIVAVTALILTTLWMAKRFVQIEGLRARMFRKISESVNMSFVRLCGVILALSGFVSTALVVFSVRVVISSIPGDNSLVESLSGLVVRAELHPDTATDRYLQKRLNTCGPAALAYLLNYYGLHLTEDEITERIRVTVSGTSMRELKVAAEMFGFSAKGYSGNIEWLKKEAKPLIAHIDDRHYVVVNDITDGTVYLFDPGQGHVIYPLENFEEMWDGNALIVRSLPIE